MRFGRFRIDRERLTLEHEGHIVALAPKSVELLLALVERSGEIVSKHELLDRVWPDSSVEEANLSQHVYVIRKILEAQEPAARSAIVTIPKRGYRFVAPPAASGRERTEEPSRAKAAEPEALTPVSAHSSLSARLWRYSVAFVLALILTLTAGATGQVSVSREVAYPGLSVSGLEAARLGRYYLDLRTPTGINRSGAYFARVIASDPRNPVGYAGLADAMIMTADYRVGPLPRARYLHEAAGLARRAVALGPTSAEAHTSVAVVAEISADWRTAQREFELAIALDPSYAPAHHWLGTLLFDRGEFGRSLHELTIATQLNPISTASNVWLELAAYFVQRYDTAIEHGNRAIELDPTRRDSLRELGLAYEAKGDHRAALATFARIRKTDEESPSVPYLVAAVYAHAGQPAIARRIIARERPRNVVDPELPFALLALGDAKAAVAAATRVRFHDCRDRRMFVADPRLVGLRDNGAFGSVLGNGCADRG